MIEIIAFSLPCLWAKYLSLRQLHKAHEASISCHIVCENRWHIMKSGNLSGCKKPLTSPAFSNIAICLHTSLYLLTYGHARRHGMVNALWTQGELQRGFLAWVGLSFTTYHFMQNPKLRKRLAIPALWKWMSSKAFENHHNCWGGYAMLYGLMIILTARCRP